jgi:phage tail-like protein
MIWKVLRRSVLRGMSLLAVLGLAGSASASSEPASDTSQTVQTANETGSFSVTIGDTTIDEWTRVTIPGSRSSETDYRDGDRSGSLIGQNEYDDLVMEREFQPGDDQLWAWRTAALEGRIEDARRTVTVTLQNDQNQAQLEWELTDAWVKEYDTLELEGGDYGETAVESVTVQFDGFTRQQP